MCFLVQAALLLFAGSADATELCLNTKVWSRQIIANIYVPELWGHHAYLSIEKGKELITGFGFWEKVGLNNPPNLPVTEEKRRKNMPARVVTEGKLCQVIQEEKIEALLNEARAYRENHGEYHKYFNNCVEFAEHFFEKYTGVSVPPLLNSPYFLHLWMKVSQPEKSQH